jgi:hypothetical protein
VATRTRKGVGALALAGVVVLTLALGSVVALADTLTIETFTGTAVSNPSAWVGGGDGNTFTGWPGKACLSAGTDTTQAPIPGCGSPAADPAGSGVLRLTTLSGNTGFALYNQALPTSGGLDISFHQAQWGGSGADGQALYLVDGATDLTAPGGGGGNLGYSPGDQGGVGVDNGLIGIGLDAFGNYSCQCTMPVVNACAAGTGVGSAGPGQTPNRVVIRGPGNGTSGYCFLGSSDDITPALHGSTRADSAKLVRVVVDPDTVAGTRNVTVYLDGTQVVQVPAPQALLDAPTFKFGFSGSIGGANDFHEVWDLDIESVIPITPVTPIEPVTPAEPVAITPLFTG